MIKIITGVPGSGKTFYAVNEIVSQFCSSDDSGLPSPLPDVCLISNIEGLKIPHVRLSDAIRDTKNGLIGFFNVEFQKKIVEKHKNVVYFLDEAQNFFPWSFKDRDVFYFFEFHRHLGIEIYLMTQSLSLISKNISALAEFEIHSIPKTLSIFGEFKYSFKVNKEILNTKVLKKNKKIFDLYKSIDVGKMGKAKNPLKKYLALSFIGLVLSSILFYYMFFRSVSNSEASPRDSRSVAVSGPSPNPVQTKIRWVSVNNYYSNGRYYVIDVDGNVELASSVGLVRENMQGSRTLGMKLGVNENEAWRWQRGRPPGGPYSLEGRAEPDDRGSSGGAGNDRGSRGGAGRSRGASSYNTEVGG